MTGQKSGKSALFAWSISGIGVLSSFAGIIFAYQYRAITVVDTYVTWQSRLIGLIPLVLGLLIGGLIAARQPKNRAGWALLAGMFASSFQTLVESLGIYGYRLGHWPDGLIVLLSFFAGVAWTSTFAMVSLLLLWFPNGDYLTRRWRITGWITSVAMVLGIAGASVMAGPLAMVAPLDNPFGIPGLGRLPELILVWSAFTIFGMALLGVLSIIIRYRRSSEIARQQIKWFGLGATLFGIILASDLFFELPGLWESVKESLGLAFLPLTIGISILRFRLYDIDLIIRRTLQYTLLTGLLALAYFGGVVVLQGLLEPLTGSGQTPLVTVVTTLIVAALFSPLRARTQAFIDRRFFRQKYNAEQMLDAFARIARDEVDLDNLAGALLGVVEGTVQPRGVELWLGEGRQ